MATIKVPQLGSGLGFPAIFPGTSQVVAIGGAHAESAVTGSSMVRLVATSDCWIAIGANPIADKVTSLFLPTGAVEYFGCKSTDLVSVLQDSAAGSLIVTPAQEIA